MSLIHKKHQRKESEESFFVSMTDLMVGMLFIFIIMLMSFALNFKKSQDNLEKRVEIAEKTRTLMLNEIKNLLEKNGVEVILDESHGILRLPENILFSSGHADLSSKWVEALNHLSDSLFNVLPCYSFNKQNNCSRPASVLLDAVFVEGHTDNIPLAKGHRYKDNLDLSAARAINTYRIILNRNSGLNDLKNDQLETLLSVSGYGENRPLNNNRTRLDREKNRRIDLRFLMASDKPKELKHIERSVNYKTIKKIDIENLGSGAE